MEEKRKHGVLKLEAMVKAFAFLIVKMLLRVLKKIHKIVKFIVCSVKSF